MYDLFGCKYKDFLVNKNFIGEKNQVFSKKKEIYML